MTALNDNLENHVLLVEDDRRLAQMIHDYLVGHDFRVTVEPRGDAAVERIVAEGPAAVLLDVNLPGLDGFSVCRRVRPRYVGPILILTARGEEVDEVVGLEVGADDYLAKPVRPRVLLARLRAHLRRTLPIGPHQSSRIVVGQLTIDAARRTVELDTGRVDLTTAEFELLWLLAERAGHVLSRKDLFLRLHGVPYDGLDRSIDLRISRLRKKLEDDPDDPRKIKSIRGVGYLLSVEP